MQPNNTQPIPSTPLAQSAPAPTAPTSEAKPKGLLITAVVAGVLALAGIGAAVYFFVDSNGKTQEIATLKANLDAKNARINELEEKLDQEDTTETTEADTEAEDEVAPTESTTSDASSAETKPAEQTNTVSILTRNKLEENGTRTTYEIGTCTIDPPSTKCSVVTNQGEALLSLIDTDGVLKLIVTH